MLAPAGLKHLSNVAVARRAPGFPCFNNDAGGPEGKGAKSTHPRGIQMSGSLTPLGYFVFLPF